MLTELNRDTYLRYLEADYSKRMVEQHKGELGIFGRVGPTFELAEGEEHPESLDQFLSNQMPKIIEDDTVLKQIDSEISDLTSGAGNEESKAKNLKTKIDD